MPNNMSKEQLIKALEVVLNVKCETIYTKNSSGDETLRYQFTIPLDKSQCMCYNQQNYVITTMDNEQLLEEMEVQANEDGFIYDDATYALEIDYTTQT